MSSIIALSLTFLLSTLFVKLFLNRAALIGLMDVPNSRSAHIKPTPRGGGLVFVAVWSLACFVMGWWRDTQTSVMLACPLMIALLGLWDDRYQLSARVKFLVQTAVALVFCLALAPGNVIIDLGLYSVDLPDYMVVPLFTLLIVWSVNIFNFMDGVDGLAALEGLTVLLSGCFFFWMRDQENGHMGMFLHLSFALAGFLIWNFPKASVFMGDVGSGFLGFMLAFMAIVGQLFYNISIFVFMIVYGVFIVDTFVTIVRRISRGEKWYLPHSTHAYQRLQHIVGWSHSSILFYVAIHNIMLFVIACLVFFSKISPGLAWCLYLSVLASYMGGVEILCSGSEKGGRRAPPPQVKDLP